MFEDEPFDQLSGLRFHHLLSFTLLRTEVKNSMLIRAKDRLTDFLMSHDTIEELSIGNIVEPDPYRFTPDTLPRLHSFAGPASTVGGMVSIKMKSLSTTLRDLVIRPSTFPIDLMFALVPSPDIHNTVSNPLSILQDIRLYNTSWGTADEIRRLLRECARCCGASLEVWRGTLAVGTPQIVVEVTIPAVELGQLFGAFTRLRVIHLELRELDNEGSLESDFVEHVQELARQCATLQTIHISVAWNMLEYVWTINRMTWLPDMGNDICQTRECTCQCIHISRSSRSRW